MKTLNGKNIFASMPKGTIWAMTVLFYACLVLFSLAPAFAALNQISFNDPSWQWYDGDGSSGTAYNIINNNNVTVEANGDDVWTGDDEYAAFWINNVQGDFRAQVQIVNQENTNEWAKAGIMVRNNITKNGPSGHADNDGYAIAAITPGNGYTFQWDSGGGNGYLDDHSTTYGSPSSSYPSYIRLVKVGTTFTAYYKMPGGGNPWVQFGTQIIGSADTIQDIGLFVCSCREKLAC